MTALVLVLAVVGALAEGAGIYLAVKEVQDRRDDVKQYEHRPVTVHPSAFTSSSGMTVIVTSGGEPPSLKQRVLALEEQAKSLASATAKGDEQVGADAERKARAMVEDARKTIDHEVAALRELLLHVTRPNATVWLSLVLLALGLMLQALASVLGSLR